MSIATARPVDPIPAMLARIRTERLGFLRDTEIAVLVVHPQHRLTQVLVRCGGCRFICAAQDVTHLEQAIESIGDYVRDVSLPATEGGR